MRAVMSLAVLLWFSAVSGAVGQEAWPRGEPADVGLDAAPLVDLAAEVAGGDFGYVDRVAVSASARRQGVASRLYDDFANALRGEVEVMTCEVNIRPPNESSMRYHEIHGFRQVASQETEGGKKMVAMMEKVL